MKFGNLQVQQLTFGYQGETILKDVTVEFSPGAITGVTGKSGSGKSTLLKLMMRFWKIQEGSIRISDTDIEEINTENLREMEGFMTQETHLFHDSIKNNLFQLRLKYYVYYGIIYMVLSVKISHINYFHKEAYL